MTRLGQILVAHVLTATVGCTCETARLPSSFGDAASLDGAAAVDASDTQSASPDAHVVNDGRGDAMVDAGFAVSCHGRFSAHCDGTTAVNCVQGVLVAQECADTVNPLCFVTPATRAICVAAFDCSTNVDPCPLRADGIPWTSTCSSADGASVLVYGRCARSTTGQLVCAPGRDGFGQCVAAETCDADGAQCEGTEHVRCFNGRVTRTDCAARGQTCFNEDGAVFCEDPSLPRCEQATFQPRCDSERTAVTCGVRGREQRTNCGEPSICCVTDNPLRPCCVP